MRTIAHLSDLHFGRVDPPVVEALRQDLHRVAPDLVIVSGDLTQRARSSQFTQAAAFLASLPAPRLVVPGNHDVPLHNVLARFTAPLKRYQTHICTDLNPVYRDEELLVIGLTTARPLSRSIDGFWKDGRVPAAVHDRVVRTLGEDDGSRFRILVLHHPFVPAPQTGQGGGLRGAAESIRRLAQARIDLILSGHLHVAYHGDIRDHYGSELPSIRAVQAASATSTRRRNQPNSYNLLTVDDATVRLDVRSYGGADFAWADSTVWPRTRASR